MARQLVEMTIEANEQVLAKVLDPAQYALQMPYRIGWTFGLGVMSAGVTVTMLQASGLDSNQVAAQLIASGSAGLSGAMLVTSALTFQSWRFIRQASTRRRETWAEDEGEVDEWHEPERPEFLPSFVQKAHNHYTRINHDLNGRELRLLAKSAKVGERFPTRSSLFNAGFTNNGQRFADLRQEFFTKGVLDAQNRWSDVGVKWVHDELASISPTPN